MTATPRLGLPFLSAGQAAKEIAHNESLQQLDAIVCAAVEGPPVNTPPPAPAIGACYLAGDAPAGAWAGKPQCIASFTSGGWRFVGPFEGLTAYVRSTGIWGVYRAGAWELGQVRGAALVFGGKQVVGPRGAAIGSASGGTTVDAQARQAIDLILSAMRQHGLIET